MLTITNGRVWTREGLRKGNLVIENGRIKELRPQGAATGDVLDAKGAIVSPGFIDIHIHGTAGHAADGGVEAVQGMATALVQHGVTSFLPSIAALPLSVMGQAVADIHAAQIQQPLDAANILGCHLEAPFLNPVRKGAQNEDHMVPPTIENFETMQTVPDTIRHITIAPELPGAQKLARYIRTHYPAITISCGHSDADIDIMTAAAEWGFSHVTHLFNGMNPLHHRNPGVAGTALWSPWYTVEIIADNVHLHPAILALVARCKPGCLLVTDAIEAAGLPDGEYSLGDKKLTVRNGRATMGPDTIAGSTLSLNKGVANMTQHVPIHHAIAMASLHPARLLKEAHRGHLDPGAWADICIMDDNCNVQATLVSGRPVYRA